MKVNKWWCINDTVSNGDVYEAVPNSNADEYYRGHSSAYQFLGTFELNIEVPKKMVTKEWKPNIKKHGGNIHVSAIFGNNTFNHRILYDIEVSDTDRV
jgi:hypothetical protein